MDIEIFKIIGLLISGAAIPIITTYFNNKYQVKRDMMKYTHERQIEREKREVEEIRIMRDYQIKSIEEIQSLLSYFQHTISLTSSVIDSSKKLKPEEFDVAHKLDLEQLTRLKSIVLARFPAFYDNIETIGGLHNQYWGNQSILLRLDVNLDKKSFSIMQKKIIEISDSTNAEIFNLIKKLRDYSES